MTLPLFVLTSSEVKFSHISYLCSRHNVESIRLPYHYLEVQDNKMRKWLKFSLENTSFPVKDKVFFIIEQTSVFLDSFPGSKGPGVLFKDWWHRTSKSQFKSLISRDPRATIESGVALSIPGNLSLIFINKQRGSVSLDGYILPQNMKYPWLSSDDFNLYFVPSGASGVYNSMHLEETLKYDFRKPNIDKVCGRIREYSSILSKNITLQDITSIAKSFRGRKQGVRQERLFSKDE